jgi:D-alanyl-D-alanine carboxypeptidase
MNKLLIRIQLLLLLTLAASSNAQNLELKFQKVLDSVYKANPDAVGIMIHVESSAKGVSWTSAAGYSDKELLTPIDKDQPVLLASNTKIYVAAAVLKLIEDKKIRLNDNVRDLITKKSRKLFEKDGYDLTKITIKHLLSHTSGIADYVNDDYFEFVNKNPDHKWTRDEQITLSVDVGSPLSQPGEKYKYADINYLLLTEIIEGITKKPFYTAIPELLSFRELGLNSTWFVDLQEKPLHTKPLVHHYWDKYKWDSYALNPSWDLYGGGGLASTTKDLALFFQLLFDGKIIKDPVLLEEMHTLVLSRSESTYCLGVRNILFAGTTTAYYHGGFWGTDAMYIPELGTTITMATLQKDKRDLNAAISQIIIGLIKDRSR